MNRQILVTVLECCVLLGAFVFARLGSALEASASTLMGPISFTPHVTPLQVGTPDAPVSFENPNVKSFGSLPWAKGVGVAAGTAGLALFMIWDKFNRMRSNFQKARREQRQPPPVWLLVGMALLLHVVTVVVDIALVTGELAGAVLEVGPISELFLGGAAFFITNLDVAFSVYVYRVVTSPRPETVRLDLNPLNAWGLRSSVSKGPTD